MKSSLLITGATGFIGRAVINSLLSKRYDLHAVGRQRPADFPESITFHSLDLLDSAAVDQFFRKNSFHRLLHLAWFVGEKCHSSPVNLDWLGASLRLLQCFHRSGGQEILLAGSVSEYDFRYGYLSEHLTPLESPSLYGRAKASLFRLASTFCEQNQLLFKWSRIFNVYGPRERATRLMPSVIGSMLKNETVRVSDCRKFQDYLHVDDMAEALVAHLESPVFGPVNLCSGRPIQLRTIVETIGRLTHFKGSILWGAIPSHFNDPLVVGNPQRLENEIKWMPQIPLEEGLQSTINWWRQFYV